MKKTFFLLTIIPLFNLSGLASPLDFGKKWPVYWNQFKSQPYEGYKKYITVTFTNSIKEACENFEKAVYIEKLKETEWNVYEDNLPFFSEKEYKKARQEQNERASDLRIATIRKTTTAVEILRQAGYRDWKKYSRWSTYGVGDLWRESLKDYVSPKDLDSIKKNLDSIKNHPYQAKTIIRAEKECELYGHKVKYRAIDIEDMQSILKDL